MPESDPEPSVDVTQPVQQRPGTNPSAPSSSHYAVELPYAEELQAMLEGRYIVESFLGQGGMGAVYKGLQLPLKRPVAIKILQKKQAGAEEDDFAFEERFKREAYAMASLTHPNIVQVYDCGDAGENFLFISMELLQGGDLSDAIKAGQCTPEVALKLIGQICDGLQAAHERGIVHRDIKPANIFLTADGRAKVADFGLAKKLDAKSTFVTKTGLGMGTPDYAAPEQYEPELGIDHRADIYALGVMMYQMLTGRLPRGVYKMPSQLVPIDPRIDAVVSRAMMSDREDRWQSAAEIKQALQEIAAGPAKPAPAPAPVRTSAVPTAARTVPTGATQRPTALQPARGPVAQTPGTSRPMPAPAPAQPAKKSSALLLAGVVGLATVVALGGFFMMNKPSAKAPSAAAPVPTQAGTTGLPPSTTGETWVDGLAKWWASPHNIAGGLLVKTADGSTFSRRGDLVIDGKMENVVVRATVRKINWYAEVRALGSGDQPGAQDSLVFGLMVRNDGELSLVARNYKVSNSGRDLLRRRMPPGFAKDARYELEVRVENGTATALLNGEQVASGPVSKGRGGVILAGGEGMIVERFEYADLGAGGAVPGTPAGARAEFGGHRYELAKGALTWDEARARAEAMGGHLATVTSREEDEFIKRVFRDGIKVSNHAWIGASRAIGSPEWKWVTGEVLNFKAWAVGQPDVKIDYGAAASYWRREEGIVGWDDTPGSDTRRESFLVEWEPAVPAAPGAVNLLAAVDVNRGRVDGNWSLKNGELVGEGGFARLVLGQPPPAEYDFRVRFTRQSGHNAVAQHVMVNGRDVMWIMGGFSNSACGFELVDGAPAKANITTVNSGIENGRTYESVVKVRRDRLQVLLDGRMVVDYKTDGSNLSVNPRWTFPEAGKLGLGCQQPTTFHSVEVIPVGSTGQPAAAAAPVLSAVAPAPMLAPLPPAPTTPRQTIDLISLLDLAKDRMDAKGAVNANAWKKSGSVLTYESDNAPGKVTAPISLNGLRDYEIGVVARRVSGNDRFNLDLPFLSGRQCTVSVFGPEIRLYPVRSAPLSLGAWPSDAAGDVRVVARVRCSADGSQATVTVSVNGRPAAQWEGVTADLGAPLDPHREFPNQNVTSLYLPKDSFAFAAWQLRVYEGEARPLRGGTATAPVPASVAAAPPPATGGKAAVKLFNGTSLEGWQSAPEGVFTIEDGALKTSAKGNIVFVGTGEIRPPWRDFELAMQVKSTDKANSGVWVHCPSAATAMPAFALEVQIDNTATLAQTTGSIFGVAPSKKPPPSNGKWFELRVRVKDRTITVLVDGEVVNEWTQPADWTPPDKVANARLGEGSIGFQSYGGTVLIKDIVITAP